MPPPITDCILHCETLLWATPSFPGYFEHARHASIIHQSENASAVLTGALCCGGPCKFDLFYVYCNWANRHFMSFILTLICYHVRCFWRSNCEEGRQGREREWGGYLFHQLSLKSCITPHELHGMRKCMNNIINQTGALDFLREPPQSLSGLVHEAWCVETELWWPAGGLCFIYIERQFYFIFTFVVSVVWYPKQYIFCL